MPSERYSKTVDKTCKNSGFGPKCKDIPFGKIYTKGFVIDLYKNYLQNIYTIKLDDIVRIIDYYLYSKNTRIIDKYENAQESNEAIPMYECHSYVIIIKFILLYFNICDIKENKIEYESNNLTKTNEILKTLRPEVGTSDKLALLKLPDRSEPHSLLLCNDNNTNYHIYSRYGQKVKKPIKIPIAIFEISFTIINNAYSLLSGSVCDSLNTYYINGKETIREYYLNHCVYDKFKPNFSMEYVNEFMIMKKEDSDEDYDTEDDTEYIEDNDIFSEILSDILISFYLLTHENLIGVFLDICYYQNDELRKKYYDKLKSIKPKNGNLSDFKNILKKILKNEIVRKEVKDSIEGINFISKSNLTYFCEILTRT